jgi:hypothetical protein
MGEPYCNDPRCQKNRRGERHKAHVIGEEQAGIYLGENYCNDPRCPRNRDGQKHEAHTESNISNEMIVDKRFDTTNGYTYCNDPRCQTNRSGERHRQHSPENPDFYYIKYLGGHKAFPTPTDTKMHFYYDRVEIDNPKLIVPYRYMQNIENTNEKKTSWKKKHIYTIIRFRDYLDDQMIVLDFDKNIDSAQSVIYRRMLEFRNSKKF